MPSFTAVYPLPQQFTGRDRWVRRLFLRPGEPGWSIWQASDHAAVDGISRPVDLDLWRPGT